MSLDSAESTEFVSRPGRESDGTANEPQPKALGFQPVSVWGVPFAPFTMAEAVVAIERLVDAGRPSYFITANVHYAMLTDENPDLQVINQGAAFILADGAPLVWASHWRESALPERVAGSDLIFELSAAAAKKGHRLFFLGGAEGVATRAVEELRDRCPGLQIAGVESPPFRELSVDEHDALVARIRAARPEILLTAFTMPRGERWLAANCDMLGIPVSVNVGAAIDFAAGHIRRAPRWMQRCGLEWAFRLGLEPRRLFGRYARNAWFVARMITRDVWRRSAESTRSAN